MMELRSHYHLLSKRHMQHVLLLLSAVVMMGLVLCSIVFSYGYKTYHKTIHELENTYQINVSWEYISIGLLGSMTIKDFYVYEKISKDEDTASNEADMGQTYINSVDASNLRQILYIDTYKMKIDVILFIKYIFSAFDTLSEYDQERLQIINKQDKASIQYGFIKALTRIDIEDVVLRSSFPRDEMLFRLLSESIFVMRILPERAILSINNASGRVDTDYMSYILENGIAQVTFSDSHDIEIEYGGKARIRKFAQDISFTVTSGHVHTHDFFTNLSMTSLIADMSWNNYITVKPMIAEVNKQQNEIIFSIIGENPNTSIVGSVYEGELEVLLNLKQTQISDILQIDDNERLLAMTSHKLDGQGIIRSNFNKNIFEYSLSLRNAVRSNKDIIDINFYGDNSYITFDTFLIDVNNQYIDIRGNLSFLTLGMQGSIALNLDDPIVNVPIEFLFHFENNPYMSIGKSSIFTINNMPQPSVLFEYSLLNKSIFVKLGTILNPVVEVNKMEDDDVLNIKIQSLPLNILDALSQSNVSIFTDSILDGDIAVRYQNDIIQDIDYSIQGSNTVREKDYLYMKGQYRDDIVSIEEGVAFSELLYNTSTYINGNFNVKNIVGDSTLSTSIVDLIVEIVDQNDVRHIYDIDMERTDPNTISLNINDTFKSSLQFATQYSTILSSLETINITSNRFKIPIIDMTLSGTMNAVLNKLAIKNFTSDMEIVDTSFNSFSGRVAYTDNEGRISDVVWQSNDRVLEGIGSIQYTRDRNFIQVQLLEVPSLDSSSVGKKTINTVPSQSYKIGYNFDTQDISMQVRDVKLGFFSTQVSGNISSDLIVNLRTNTMLGTILPSQIVYKSNKYSISGDVVIEGFNSDGDISLSNVNLQVGNTELLMQDMQIQDYQLWNGNFSLTQLQGQNKYRKMFDGVLNANTERSAFDFITGKRDTALPTFNASIQLIPVFTTDRSILNKFTYQMSIVHQDQMVKIVDMRRNIFLNYNVVDHTIDGYIGSSNSMLQMAVDGEISIDTLNIDITLHHFDAGTFNRELTGNHPFMTLENMLMQGKISLRGSIYDINVYGYVDIEIFEGYMSYFDKDIRITNAIILMSNNEISMANAFVEVDGDVLLVNANGLLNGLGIDFIHLDFIAGDGDNQYFQSDKIRLNTMVIEGEIKGKVSVVIDQQFINVFGNLFMRNTLLSNDTISIRQQQILELYGPIQDELTLTVDITVISESGVVFKWPTSNFPILTANFARDQMMNAKYNGETQAGILEGDIIFDGGTIYYLDKGFNISDLHIIFDELNSVDNPFVVSLDAKIAERYDNQSYDIHLSAETTLLSDMEVNISTNPYLSNDEISQLFGQGIVPDNQDTSTSSGLVSTFVKLSDPVSNIGLFSQFESMLQRSLRVDYLAFRTKFIQNILEYSLRVNEAQDTAPFTRVGNVLPYLFNQSSLEIGKYIDIIYFNFTIMLDSEPLFNNINNDISNFIIPISTSLNVELPTPYFDLTWTIDPVLFDSQNQYVPMNLLTISWQKKF